MKIGTYMRERRGYSTVEGDITAKPWENHFNKEYFCRNSEGYHKDIKKEGERGSILNLIFERVHIFRAHVSGGGRGAMTPEYFRIYLIGVVNLDIFKNFILVAAPPISDPNVGPVVR